MDPARTERIAASQARALTALMAQAITAVQAGNPVDSLLARFYHEHSEFGSRDRRLFSSVIFGYFRWKGWLDIVASSPDAACVFAYLLECTELHPAILNLANKAGLPESMMVPMGTRPPLEKSRALGQITGHTLNLNQLVPDWVLPLLDPAQIQRVMESFQSPPPTWLRTHPDDRDDILARLREQGGEPAAHPSVPSAVSVARGINLRALPRTCRTLVDVQDLASQVTGLVCDPQPGQSWWDACCGSGGKTQHLAALGGPSVSILATDIRSSILGELTRRLGETGIGTIRTALWDGATEPAPTGPFDGILLDAPCSGTGTWHRNPDARWRITRDTVIQLAGLQSTLLRACSTRVKLGGVLVYATCSLTTLENEEVITDFLKTTPGFRLDPFINPLTHARCDGLLRINPWDGPCNGMFIARLRRID